MKKLMLKTIAASMLFAAGTTVYAKDVKIGVSFQNMQNEFIIYMSDALRAKAKTLGVSLVESDGQGKAENQVSAVENFIAQKVDAIVLNPYDKEGCAPAVEKAVADTLEAGLRTLDIAVDPQMAVNTAEFGNAVAERI